MSWMRGEARPERDTWAVALAKALVLLAVAYVGFAFIADRLVGFLATRVSPVLRDLLVAGWFVVVFVGLSIGFIVLQLERRGG